MHKRFVKFKRTSNKLINELTSKLKMIKKNTVLNTFVNDEGNSTINDNDNKKSDNSNVILIPSKNIPIFCEQLEKFIDEIKLSTNFQYHVYDYPFILEKRLENSVNDLEYILREIKNAHDNIKKQKTQQNYVNREKILLNKTLKKLRDNEIREMETIISIFDNSMYTRWQSIKSTRKIDVLERFLSDIKSKQLALENLNTLVSRKLTNVTMFSTSNDNITKKKIFSKAIPLPFTPIQSTGISIISLPSPTPPPLPILLNAIVPISSQIPTRTSIQRDQIEKLRNSFGN